MRQRMLGYFVLLFLLCGCHTEGEPLQTQRPVITPSVETAALPPSPTPVPTPEPTPSIEEQFRAAEGKDLYLWSGKLSESQEFLENSGYFNLKEPRQSVDAYSRSYGGGTCVEVFRDEQNVKDVVLLTNKTGLCQEVPLVSERHSAGIGGVIVTDANFDSEDDILLYIGGERGGCTYYALFLWEAEKGQFRYEPSFSEIPTPKFDVEHQVIWGGSDYNYGHYYYAYELLDDSYVKTHYLAAEQGANIVPTCTEYLLRDSILAEVSRWEFPHIGEETEWVNLVDALEAYINAGTVWEGWAWCDPRAYERFG